MKKRILLALVAVVMASMMLVTSVSAASVEDFTDKNEWPADWAADSISYVIENDLMSGTGAGRFDYAGQVTRAQMAQMLYNLDKAVYGEPTIDSEAKFEDITSDVAWAATAINWAADKGIVTGTNPEGTAFNPKGLITNGAMAKMLYGYVVYRGCEKLLDITRVDDTLVPVDMFYEDMMGEWESSQWFYDSVVACGQAALLVGSPNADEPDYPLFNLNNTSMRAQAAIILTRLHKFLTIETLDAEVALAAFDSTYCSCAHPGTVYFVYGGNGKRNEFASAQLGQSQIQSYNGKYIYEMFDDAIAYDADKWTLVIDNLAEKAAAYAGGESGSAQQITFWLELKADPSVKIERSVYLSMQQQAGPEYERVLNYGGRVINILPSNWHCHERKGNYAADVQSYLEGEAAKYAAEYIKDGKITLYMNLDTLVGRWTEQYVNSIQGVLFGGYSTLGGYGDVAIYIPDMFDGDKGLAEKYMVVTGTDEDGDPISEPGTALKAIQDDYADDGKATFKETLRFAYNSSREYTEYNSKFFTEENWPHVDMEVEFTIIRDKNITCNPDMYGVVKSQNIEDITLDALGDFYCAECGAMTVVAGQNWHWTDSMWKPDLSGMAFDGWAGFFLYELRLHAISHMNTSKYAIVGIEMSEEAIAAAKACKTADSASTQFEVTLAVAKVGDTANAVKFTIPVNYAANHHLASFGTGWIDGDANGNGVVEEDEGWDTFTDGCVTTDTTGNGQKQGNHFGVCKHTDPTVESGAILDDLFAEYYCDIHDCIHLNTHNAGEITDKKIREDRKFLLGLFWDYNNGSWTKRYNEGKLKITNFNNAIGLGSAPILGADGVYRTKVVVGLKGYYDTETAYRIYNIEMTANTTIPTQGVVPAMATLTNSETGETKAFCASTQEYADFLAECDKADERMLDAALAKFQTSEYVTVYYPYNDVHGGWDPMFFGQTVLSLVDLDTSFVQKWIEGNWYSDANDDHFKSFFPNGWWGRPDGEKVCENAKITTTFKLAATGRTVEKTLGVTMIASRTITTATLEKPVSIDEFVAAKKAVIEAACQKFNANGTVTIAYNTDYTASYDFAQLITAWIPDISANASSWYDKDFAATRLPKQDLDGDGNPDAWVGDPAIFGEADDNWDCKDATVMIEFVIAQSNSADNIGVSVPVKVTLVKDASLEMNTSVVK